MDQEAIQKTLSDIEDQLKKLETTKEVLKGMLITGGVGLKSIRRPRKGTHKDLIVNILKESGSPLTTREISKKISALKNKEISQTSVRIVLNREKKLFKKAGKRQWTLIAKE